MNRALAVLLSVVILPLVLIVGLTPVNAAWKDCIYPKSKAVSHHLVFLHPVFIYTEPGPASRRTQLKLFESFNVVTEKNGFYQIAGAADAAPDFKEGQIIGWVRKTDFDSLPYRNCH